MSTLVSDQDLLQMLSKSCCRNSKMTKHLYEHCSIRSRFTSNVIEVMMQYACICRHIMGFIPFSPLNINFSMSKLEKVQNPIK